MTGLMLEQLNVPASARDLRLRERARSEALDDLADRTVWCAAALPERRPTAEALRSRLSGAGAGARSLQIGAGTTLQELARQLDMMLSRAAGIQWQLRGEQEESYARGAADADTLIGAGVRRGDVVVISDPSAAIVAEAVHERGALVAWQLELRPGYGTVACAWRFIQRRSPPIDAYLTSWSTSLAGGRTQSGVAARIPGADALTAKRQTTGAPSWDEELSWSRLLADVVRAGHEEHVGGTVHVRPTIAAR